MHLASQKQEHQRAMTEGKKPGCLASIFYALDLMPQPAAQIGSLGEQEATWPYHVRDDFLSPAELNFYRVLCTATGDWAVICPKVSLGDLFYAQTADYATNTAYRNKIDRKHVDFLLCDAHTIRPLIGIELDNASHRSPSRRERDDFVEEVFQAAGLPLLRIDVHAAYSVRALAASLKDWAGILQEEAAGQTGQEPPAQAAVASADASAGLQPDQARGQQPLSPTTTVTPPACPKCGQPMVLRTSQKEGPHKGKPFWGCRDSPRCRGLRQCAPE
jgi:hypothetical protein